MYGNTQPPPVNFPGVPGGLIPGINPLQLQQLFSLLSQMPQQGGAPLNQLPLSQVQQNEPFRQYLQPGADDRNYSNQAFNQPNDPRQFNYATQSRPTDPRDTKIYSPNNDPRESYNPSSTYQNVQNFNPLSNTSMDNSAYRNLQSTGQINDPMGGSSNAAQNISQLQALAKMLMNNKNN
jgi:hypothetical protein